MDSRTAPTSSQLQHLLKTWQEGMQAGGGWNALFWCNHDQPRVVSRLGDDGPLHRESAKMLAACCDLMRGTPYVYQGEELGMTNAHFDSLDEWRDSREPQLPPHPHAAWSLRRRGARRDRRAVT